MPLTTPDNKNAYKVILETGEVKEFLKIRTGIRKVIEINGKKKILCISERAGFGPDTNTIIFDNEYEYGNLAPDQVKTIMNELIQNRFLDLSQVKLIDEKRTCKIQKNIEYLLKSTVRIGRNKDSWRGDNILLFGKDSSAPSVYSDEFFEESDCEEEEYWGDFGEDVFEDTEEEMESEPYEEEWDGFDDDGIDYM